MTKTKLCGLRRPCDIEYVNGLMPDYIGFVFAKNSKRYVTPDVAETLRKKLSKAIVPVGVFVDEKIDVITELLERHVIEAVQLHGNEDDDYIHTLKKETKAVIIKAFRIKAKEDIMAANASTADYVLLDSDGGSGETFDWSLIREMKREYFLAGGLSSENVSEAISKLHPFAVDASSSLETEGYKDKEKMTAFVNAVRQEPPFGCTILS